MAVEDDNIFNSIVIVTEAAVADFEILIITIVCEAVPDQPPLESFRMDRVFAVDVIAVVNNIVTVVALALAAAVAHPITIEGLVTMMMPPPPLRMILLQLQKQQAQENKQQELQEVLQQRSDPVSNWHRAQSPKKRQQQLPLLLVVVVFLVQPNLAMSRLGRNVANRYRLSSQKWRRPPRPRLLPRRQQPPRRLRRNRRSRRARIMLDVVLLLALLLLQQLFLLLLLDAVQVALRLDVAGETKSRLLLLLRDGVVEAIILREVEETKQLDAEEAVMLPHEAGDMKWLDEGEAVKVLDEVEAARVLDAAEEVMRLVAAEEVTLLREVEAASLLDAAAMIRISKETAEKVVEDERHNENTRTIIIKTTRTIKTTRVENMVKPKLQQQKLQRKKLRHTAASHTLPLCPQKSPKK
jgi:hypothetical protein